MAFASNGVFHPTSLLFVDWFLCRASRQPLAEPPSNEKLKMLHAMTKAIVDSTASILSEHFSKFINQLHHASFPFVLSQGDAEVATARRGRGARHALSAGTLNGRTTDVQRPVAAFTGSNTHWPTDAPPPLDSCPPTAVQL